MALIALPTLANALRYLTALGCYDFGVIDTIHAKTHHLFISCVLTIKNFLPMKAHTHQKPLVFFA